MDRYKIVFLCHFSNSVIRGFMDLRKNTLRNIILKFRSVEQKKYDDFAIWVSDYIAEFEKHQDIEMHVIAPHLGMKKKTQSFVINGINYHFFKCDGNYVHNYFNAKCHLEERNNYKANRLRIKKIINTINPNMILLCGAENPYYSTGVLDVREIPVYTILQTLLNDPKRIEMGIGTAYRRRIELDIFRYGRYFCTAGEKAIAKIKETNPNAVILPVKFPTHRPCITIPEKKEYNFVFFARSVTINKGIEDLLQALSIVKQAYNGVTLNVIGNCIADYQKKLGVLLTQLEIEDNVHFAGYYDSIEDMYSNVVKSDVAVLPGITAGLNSTVREAMFMGLPTICYETASTININKEKTCLLTAPMGNVAELAKLMILTIENHDCATKTAANAKEYVEKVYSNEAIVNQLLENCCKIIEKKV